MIETHTIHDEAAESLDVTLRVTPDPTAATPYFAISAKGVNTPGAFIAGSWRTSWVSTTGEITALTPTVGGAGAGATLAVAPGGEYWIWGKVTVGAETFVRICAVAVCP